MVPISDIMLEKLTILWKSHRHPELLFPAYEPWASEWNTAHRHSGSADHRPNVAAGLEKGRSGKWIHKTD